MPSNVRHLDNESTFRNSAFFQLRLNNLLSLFGCQCQVFEWRTISVGWTFDLSISIPPAMLQWSNESYFWRNLSFFFPVVPEEHNKMVHEPCSSLGAEIPHLLSRFLCEPVGKKSGKHNKDCQKRRNRAPYKTHTKGSHKSTEGPTSWVGSSREKPPFG